MNLFEVEQNRAVNLDTVREASVMVMERTKELPPERSKPGPTVKDGFEVVITLTMLDDTEIDVRGGFAVNLLEQESALMGAALRQGYKRG